MIGGKASKLSELSQEQQLLVQIMRIKAKTMLKEQKAKSVKANGNSDLVRFYTGWRQAK